MRISAIIKCKTPQPPTKDDAKMVFNIILEDLLPTRPELTIRNLIPSETQKVSNKPNSPLRIFFDPSAATENPKDEFIRQFQTLYATLQ